MRPRPATEILPPLLGLAGLALGVLAAPPTGRDGASILAALRAGGGAVRGGAFFLMFFCLSAAAFLLACLIAASFFAKSQGRGGEKIKRYAKPARLGLAGLLLAALGFWLIPRLASTALGAAGLDAAPIQSSQAAGQALSSAPLSGGGGGDEEIFAAPSPWLALGGGLGGLLLAAWGLSLLAARGRKGPGPAPDPAALVRAAALEAASRTRRRLELGDPVRDSVVACYAQMGEIFAPRVEAWGQKAASLTPREFASRLSGLGAPEAGIRQLTSVFEKARYSTEPCGEDDRLCALEALASLEAFAGAAAGRGAGSHG